MIVKLTFDFGSESLFILEFGFDDSEFFFDHVMFIGTLFELFKLSVEFHVVQCQLAVFPHVNRFQRLTDMGLNLVIVASEQIRQINGEFKAAKRKKINVSH